MLGKQHQKNAGTSRSLWDAMQKEKNNCNPQFTVNRSDELLYVSVIRVLILLDIST